MLRRIGRAWRRFGDRLAQMVSRVVLTAFYFTVALPFGLAVRAFSDPLGVRPAAGPGWLPKAAHGTSLEEARRQF